MRSAETFYNGQMTMIQMSGKHPRTCIWSTRVSFHEFKLRAAVFSKFIIESFEFVRKTNVITTSAPMVVSPARILDAANHNILFTNNWSPNHADDVSG